MCIRDSFKGPQLEVPTAGFCVTHFMGKDKVFDAIDRIMHACSEDERRKLKSKLTAFAKKSYKDPDAFDCGMVLAILLEFYRKEKKENFLRFQELFTLTKQTLSPRPLFPFDAFHTLISETYDKGATALEVCNVYREAYIAGDGDVTCDSVLLTFSETPFWVSHLRLKGQGGEPKYDARGDIDAGEVRGRECRAVYKCVLHHCVATGSRMKSSSCNLRSIS
eukprot:TRINITY_DN14634_c0_g1_i12.p3 TRINITY_DN14634_c0_g1~~TRINITY_DN14634_c0_g1_i12.p3  ORF type:complete len:221 (+),score=61.66 TRINITY_DN14634_c0_g1_i12:73-735(+)